MEMNKSRNIVKILLISVIIIILLTVIGIGAYFWVRANNPKTIYTSMINGYLDKYESEMSNLKEAQTQDITIKLSGNIESNNEETKQIAEYVNKGSIILNMQLDYEKEIGIMNLDLDYDNERLIDGQVYYDLNEKTAYAYLTELYDKYFKIDTSSSDFNDVNEFLKELFETKKQLKNGEKVSIDKAIKIIENKISKNLPDEYFSKDSRELTINNQSIKTTKTSLTLTQPQFKEIVNTISIELSEDEEFLNCFKEDEDKDTIKESLKNLAKVCEKNDNESNDRVVIDLYNKGFLNNEFVKLEVTLTTDEEQLFFEVTKDDDNTYSYSFTPDLENYMSGTVKMESLNENTMKFEIYQNDTKNEQSFKIEYEISNIINQPIYQIDKSNSIDVENITDDEMAEIMANFQKMKIYNVINDLTGGIFDTSLDSYNTSIDDDFNTDDYSENNSLLSENNTLTPNNSVTNYSKDVVVTYSVPSTFKDGSYTNDTYRTYEKSSDTTVTIRIKSDTLEEFSEDIENEKKSLSESSLYKDEKTSDIKTLQVNGKTFNYKMLKYTYLSGISSEYNIDYQKTYLYYKIDDNNSLIIEIENPSDVTSDELNQFLNIDIKK